MNTYLRIAAIAGTFAFVCAGARDTPGQSDPPSPGIQLGDSVTMPVKAVNAGIASSVAFYLPEKDLLPESVAFDAKDGSFYVGSVRKGKIVRRDATGAVSDFIAPRQDGLWSVIGIKVHPTRRILWVCSFEGTELEGATPRGANASGVFAFNLDTGKLIRKWVLDVPGESHGFNDLVLTRGNDAYATHMFRESSIYRITQKDQKLELFAKPEGLTDPNGITISPDEKTLYVAGNEGIMAIDIGTRTGRFLDVAGSEPAGGIDGIYYFRDSLLGIRGSSVNRYHFDDARAKITLTEVLEANHPLMKIPTTGVIVDDAFYYVANANFDAANADGTLKADQLVEPAILKLPLR